MLRREMLGLMGGVSLAALAGCQPQADPEAGATEAADADVDAIRQAFYYVYPIYEIARTQQERTGAIGGEAGTLNQIAHRALLLDHTARQVTAPNRDTIYSSAFLELSGGPMELFAPSDTERYFSIAFMDIFTDNFAYIGTRETNGQGGRFWIVGPEWDGAAPDGVQVIRSATNDVWMLARILVNGEADIPAAQALQQQIRLVAPEERGPVRPLQADARGRDSLDAAKLLAVANEMLARSPGDGAQLARAEQFASVGVGPNAQPTPDLLARWDAFMPTGIEELRETFVYRSLIVDGWAYQEEGVGNFEENDKLRAGVALGGLAALGEQEAMYFHANFEPDGSRLTGENAYRWKVPAGGVPADAFWSLTMYEVYPDGRYFLVENPLNRYSIGDRTEGLVVEPDGSFEILIQRDEPTGELRANWLPAPAGQLRLALRAYLPRQELLDRNWKVPPLERVDG